jgi:hypothetical protein
MESSWISPRELTLSVPRVVRKSRYFKLMFTLVTCLFAFLAACIAILTLGLSYNDYHKQKVLTERGIKTEGVVVDLLGIHRGGYEFAYRFTPSGLSEAQSKGLRSDYCQRGSCQNIAPINEDHYKKLAIGSKVPVIYDPATPYQAYLHFEDRINTLDPKVGLIVFGILLPIVIIFISA